MVHLALNEVPDLIPGKTNYGNENFEIGRGLGVMSKFCCVSSKLIVQGNS